MTGDVDLILDWNDARDLSLQRLAPAVARLMDACDAKDHDAARALCRELRHGCEELQAFLIPPE